MKRNYIFVILLLLISNQFAEAQYRAPSLFSSSVPRSIVLNTQNSRYGSPVAQIFQILSQNNRGRASRNSLIIQFQENLNIYRNGQSLRFVGNMSQLKLSGSTNYRAFNMGSFIRPQQVSFTLEWRSARGQRIINSFNYTVNLNTRQISLFDFSRQNPDARTNYKLSVSRYNFIFSQAEVSNLQNRIRLIDNYYKASQAIDRMSSDLTYIRTSNYDNILSNQQKIEQIKSNFSQIKTTNFVYKLNLNNQDPANFMNKSASLDNLIRQKETEMRQTQAQLPKIYLNNGIQAENQGNFRYAEDYFQKAIHLNPSFMPAKLELAQVYYQQKQNTQALQLAQEVSTSYNSDSYTRAGANTLLQKIYTHILNSAQSNINVENYQAALQDINDAYSICQQISSVSCSYNLSTLKKKALNGVYKKKLNECDKFINNSQLINASAALSDAVNFRKANNLTALHQESNYESLIKQKNYDLAIQEAENYARNNQFEFALKKYADAAKLQRQYSLTPAANVQNNINKVVANKAQRFIDQGNTELRANHLRAAKRLANKASTILKNYNVPKSNSTYQQLLTLKNSSYSAECQNYERIYENKIKQVKQHIKKAKYLMADETIDQAIAYARSKKECEIDYADAQTYKDQIKPAKNYQTKIKEIISLIDYNMFEDAIKKYKLLVDFYNDNRIDAFNITMLPLSEFAKNNSSEFILYTIKYLLNNNQNQEAYKLLLVLKNRNIRKTYTKNEQTRLGISYAKSDFENNRQQNPEDVILEYTFGDSWFNYFKKAYMMQWKFLRKN